MYGLAFGRASLPPHGAKRRSSPCRSRASSAGVSSAAWLNKCGSKAPANMAMSGDGAHIGPPRACNGRMCIWAGGLGGMRPAIPRTSPCSPRSSAAHAPSYRRRVPRSASRRRRRRRARSQPGTEAPHRRRLQCLLRGSCLCRARHLWKGCGAKQPLGAAAVHPALYSTFGIRP